MAARHTFWGGDRKGKDAAHPLGPTENFLQMRKNNGGNSLELWTWFGGEKKDEGIEIELRAELERASRFSPFGMF